MFSGQPPPLADTAGRSPPHNFAFLCALCASYLINLVARESRRLVILCERVCSIRCLRAAVVNFQFDAIALPPGQAYIPFRGVIAYNGALTERKLPR